MYDLDRTLIVGCPGSGKTFLSKKMSVLTGIPVYHLDDYYWEKDWKGKKIEEWYEIQKKLVSQESFIIDGNYLSSLEFRIKHADTIIYVNKSLIQCLFGFLKRTTKNILGKEISLPEKIKEQTNYKVNENGILSFCFYIVKFHLFYKSELRVLLSKYTSSKNIVVIRNKKEISHFLEAQIDKKRCKN